MNRIINFILALNEKQLIVAALTIIFIYFLPYFLLGEDSPILIHDNLNSGVVYVKMLLDNDLFFASPSAKMDQVFESLPSGMIYPIYDFALVIFKLFGMFWGYVVNKVLMSLIGFAGMYLLLKKYVNTIDSPLIIAVGVALLYSLLPFWSFQASVSGLPFVLYAFLNILNGDNGQKNWIVIIFFAFYSSLILAGVFLLMILGFIFLYDTIRNKKANYSYLAALLVLSVAYVISHYPLFHYFLFSGKFVSHRVEFALENPTMHYALMKFAYIFTKGHFHSFSLHRLMLLPILLPLFAHLYPSYSYKPPKTYYYILGFVFITSIFYAFKGYQLFAPYIKVITDIIPIRLERVHFLHPMLWYLLLAMSIYFIYSKVKFGKYIIFVMMGIQLFLVARQNEVWRNRANPSYKNYYATDLFKGIKEKIGKPQDTYRVISVGFQPAVSQYHGFKTTDGYLASYPLTYKHTFRKVIEKELDQNEKIQKRFDDFGSMCYAYSSELGTRFMNTNEFYYYNKNSKKITHLAYDFEQLKKLGCRYIFSVAEINLDNTPQLNHLFTEKGGCWAIYVYEIK